MCTNLQYKEDEEIGVGETSKLLEEVERNESEDVIFGRWDEIVLQAHTYNVKETSQPEEAFHVKPIEALYRIFESSIVVVSVSSKNSVWTYNKDHASKKHDKYIS